MFGSKNISRRGCKLTLAKCYIRPNPKDYMCIRLSNCGSKGPLLIEIAEYVELDLLDEPINDAALRNKTVLINNSFLRKENCFDILSRRIVSLGRNGVKCFIIQLAKEGSQSYLQDIGTMVGSWIGVAMEKPIEKWARVLSSTEELRVLSSMPFDVLGLAEEVYNKVQKQLCDRLGMKTITISIGEKAQTYFAGEIYVPTTKLSFFIRKVFLEVGGSNNILTEIDTLLQNQDDWEGDYSACVDTIVRQGTSSNFPLCMAVIEKLARFFPQGSSFQAKQELLEKFVWSGNFSMEAIKTANEDPVFRLIGDWLVNSFHSLATGAANKTKKQFEEILNFFWFMQGLGGRYLGSPKIKSWSEVVNARVSCSLFEKASMVGRVLARFSVILSDIQLVSDHHFLETTEVLLYQCATVSDICSLYNVSHLKIFLPEKRQKIVSFIQHMLIQKSDSAKDLDAVLHEMQQSILFNDFPELLGVIGQVVPKSVLSFGIKDMNYWLCCKSYITHALPSSGDILESIEKRECKVSDFRMFLDFFAILHNKEDSGPLLWPYFLNWFGKFANQYGTGTVFLEVFKHWAHNFVTFNLVEVLVFLDSLPPIVDSGRRNEFIQMLLKEQKGSSNRSFGKKAESPEEKFLTLAVNKAFALFDPVLSPSSGFLYIQKWDFVSLVTPSKIFVNKSLIFLLEKSCLVSSFEDIDRFCNIIQKLASLPSLSHNHSFVWEWIRLAHVLEGQPSGFILECLGEMKSSFKMLLSRDILESVPIEKVMILEKHKAVLDALNKSLEIYSKINLSTPLQIVQEFRHIISSFEAKIPLIRAISKYFPYYCNALNSVCSFDSNEESLKMEALKEVVMYLEPVNTFFTAIGEKERKMVHFFEIECNTSATRSVLFQFYLKEESNLLIEEDETNPANIIAAVLTRVSQKLNALIDIKSISVDEIIRVSKVMKDADRKPEVELILICKHFRSQDIELVKPAIYRMDKVMTLLGLRDTLTHFVFGLVEDTVSAKSATVGISVLQQLGYQCCTTTTEEDVTYSALVEEVQALVDARQIGNWEVATCENHLKRIFEIFQCGDDVTVVSGILRLFICLTKANKVWEFFESNPVFVSSQGNGYSDVFDEKIEDFLSELGGEDYKLLENFKVVAKWVTIALSMKGLSFTDVIRRLMESPSIMAHIGSSQGLPFEQLLTAQSHMDFVSNLFHYGLSGLDSVLGNLRDIEAGSCICFHLKEQMLSLRYFDAKRNSVVELKDDEIRDLQQRLGFIQHEEKAANYNIADCLSTFQLCRKSLLGMHNLHKLGHPTFIVDRLGMIIGKFCETNCSLITFEQLNTMDVEQQSWEIQLEEKMSSVPCMRLFTIEQLQMIANLRANNSITEVKLALGSVFKDEIVDSAMQVQFEGSSDWLTIVTRLFESMCERQSNLFTDVSEKPFPFTRVICSNILEDVYRVLAGSFPDRAPFPFELLWCDARTSKSDVLNFIDRARAFPSLRFMFIYFDKLQSIQQHCVLKSMLDTAANLSSNICCIECGPSVLQSAAWLPVGTAAELYKSVDVSSVMSLWTPSQAHTCFYGPSGSGKTFQLRKRLTYARPSIIISIDESFEWLFAVQAIGDLLKDSSPDTTEFTFAIQINVGKFRVKEEETWKSLIASVDNLLFKLLITRCIHAQGCPVSVSIPKKKRLRIYVELPDIKGHTSSVFEEDDYAIWTKSNMPTLAHAFQFLNASNFSFEIGEEAKHVCKYLKAFDNKTIDNLYSAGGSNEQDIIFVLDVSGSMAGSPLTTCQRSLRDIFERKINNMCTVGFIAFNGSIVKDIPLAKWDPNHKGKVMNSVSSLDASGGTDMWSALQHCLYRLQDSGNIESKRQKTIVALTDGDSANDHLAGKVQLALRQNPNIRVLFITVNLRSESEALIRLNCILKPTDALIRADNGQVSLVEAWKDVGERLTVSQQIEREGENISEPDCRSLLTKYMKLNDKHSNWTRLQQVFWLRYMHRRCGILASSEKFNKNENLAKFGSTTMTIMLEEVANALSNDYRIDWNATRHEQMVYRRLSKKDDNGADIDDFSWSILATNPDDNDDHHWVQRKNLLASLKLTLPTSSDLSRPDRRVLDSYLAYGLGIPLCDLREEYNSENKPFDFALGSLPILDDRNFVLTLDFTMKMLVINERIECGIPCIMEGETGVSKTALTRMLFTLKNMRKEPTEFYNTVRRISLESTHQDINMALLGVLHLLAEMWNLSEEPPIRASWNTVESLSAEICVLKDDIHSILVEELRNDISLDPLSAVVINFRDGNDTVPLLKWYITEHILRLKEPSRIKDWAFYPINVHGAMTVSDIGKIIDSVSKRAANITRLGKMIQSRAHSQAKICIFFDEINTSSCMGVLKEIIIDHSFCGVPLPRNIVVVSACNPAREKLRLHDNRKEEHGIDWVSGHYQVHPLPLSLQTLTWDYGSLQPSQEREFILKKLRFSLPQCFHSHLLKFSEIIFTAHESTRALASEHARLAIQAKFPDLSTEELDSRASSVVSLRDILRVFRIFEYLINAPTEIANAVIGKNCEGILLPEKQLVLAIAIVYYMRLGVDQVGTSSDYRGKFRVRLHSRVAVHFDIEETISVAMEEVIRQTSIEEGIASTRGLQENLFMLLMCLITRVPTMIVGPPGSSKTLAVTILTENARGEFSKTALYRSVPPLICFPYQCSRKSTSHQIQEIFERAVERQAKLAKEGNSGLCFVFMDEAGLPEEGRESLKVLHYYLEDHMQLAAQVGFVAITNHILDAAKSNRCAILMRSKPSHDELVQVCTGCLGNQQFVKHLRSSVTVNDRPLPVFSSTQDHLLDILSDAFEAAMNETANPRNSSPSLVNFAEFFGLRDFMHFIKLLGRLAATDRTISVSNLIESLERNMNGSGKASLKEIIKFILGPILPSQRIVLQNPVSLLLRSFSEQDSLSMPNSRYILIIDTTTNDAVYNFILSVVRKQKGDITMLKLSNFSGDVDLQQVNVISQVRWSAEEGKIVALSRTEPINESLYDLFNQHFRKFEDRSSGQTKIVHHTNIAVGAHSRRCKVSPGCFCLVQLTLEELQVAPAPFLNRFEKYRITFEDIFHHVLQNNSFLQSFTSLSKVLSNTFVNLQALVRCIGVSSIYSFQKHQTIESSLLSVLMNWSTYSDVAQFIVSQFQDVSFSGRLKEEYPDMREIDLLSKSESQTNYLLQLFHDDSRKVVMEKLLTASMVNVAVGHIVDASIPDMILSQAANLPDSFIEMVLSPRKFCMSIKEEVSRSNKQVLITRTSAEVVHLQSQSDNSKDILPFSKFLREADFLDCLTQFQKSDSSSLLLIFDLSMIPTSQINFAKCKVDEIFGLNPVAKNITFLLHAPSADISVHHGYDICFHEDWQYRFIELSPSCNFMHWLRFSYLKNCEDLSSEKLLRFLLESEDLVQKVIYRCADAVVVDAIGNGNKYDWLKSILLTSAHGNSIYSAIFYRFLQIWNDSDNAEPGTLLRWYIQERVSVYANRSSNLPIMTFIMEGITDLFVAFLHYFLNHLLEECTFPLSASPSDPSHESFLYSCLIKFIEVIRNPPLCALSSSLKAISTAVWSIDCCFPAFSSIHPFIKTIADAVIEVFAEDDDESTVWDRMVENGLKQIQDSSHWIASYVAADSDQAVPEPFLRAYITRLLIVKFPHLSADSIQTIFVTNWLLQQMTINQGQILMIHLLWSWYLSSIEVMVNSLSSISELKITSTKIASLVKCGSEIDDGFSDAQFSRSSMIDIVFMAFEEVSSPEQLLAWRSASQYFLLSQQSQSVNDLEGVKLKIVKAVSLLAEYIHGGFMFEEIHNACCSLIASVDKLLESKKASFKLIWGLLCERLNCIENIGMFTNILRLWFDNNWLSTIDAEYVVEIIPKNFSQTCPSSVAPALDIVLKFTSAKKPFDGIFSWIRLLDETSTISRISHYLSGKPFYTPHWMRLPTESSSDMVLCDIFFHVVWKWLTTLHPVLTLGSYLQLIQQMAGELFDRRYEGTKKILLSAFHVGFISIWAKQILASTLTSDIDEFLQVLSGLKSREEWSKELLWWINEYNSVETIVSQVAEPRTHFLAWKSKFAADNRIVELWAEAMDNLSEMPPAASATHPALFHFQFTQRLQCSDPSMVDIGRSASAHRFDGSTLSIINHRRFLRLLWVLPKLYKLYKWLTITLNSFGQVSEAAAKTLTVAELVNKSFEEYGTKYQHLWIMVKVGVNKAYDAMSNSGFRQLDDSLMVWDAVSVRQSSDLIDGRLYTIIEDFVSYYRSELFPLKNGSMTRLEIQSLDLISGFDSTEAEDNLTSNKCSFLTYLDSKDIASEFYSPLQRLAWLALTSGDYKEITNYIDLIYSSAPLLAMEMFPKRFSSFSISACTYSFSKSKFSYMLHSLEYEEIYALVQGLELLLQNTLYDSNDGSNQGTIKDMMAITHPNHDEDACMRFFHLHSSEILAYVMALPVIEIPTLASFLQEQIQLESYLFATKSMEIKKSWPAEFEERVEDQALLIDDLMTKSRNLEACLAKFEIHIASTPELPLLTSLLRVHHSEKAFLQLYPLFVMLEDTAATIFSGDGPFTLLCAHYVSLRLKLRVWSRRGISNMKKARKAWSWITDGKSCNSNTGGQVAKPLVANLDQHIVPWFLRSLAPASVEEVKYIEQSNRNKIKFLHAKVLQRFFKSIKGRRQQLLLSQSNENQRADASTMGGRGRGRGRGGRGRSGASGRGRGSDSSKSLKASIGAKIEEINQAAIVLHDLRMATDGNIVVTNVNVKEIKRLLEKVNEIEITGKESVVSVAENKVRHFETSLAKYLQDLTDEIEKSPLSPTVIESLLIELENLDCCDDEVYAKGCQVLADAKALLVEQQQVLEGKQFDRRTLLPLLHRLKQGRIAIDPKLLELSDRFTILFTTVGNVLKEIIDDRLKVADVINSLGIEDGHERVDDSELYQDIVSETQRTAVMKMLECVRHQPDRALLSKSIDNAIEALNKSPLNTWPHAELFLALCNSSASHIDDYHTDVQYYMQNYFSSPSCSGNLASTIGALVAFRWCNFSNKHLSAEQVWSCMQCANQIATVDTFMTDAEKAILQTEPSKVNNKPIRRQSALYTANGKVSAKEKWLELKAMPNNPPSEALDKLMEMVGLETVKRAALQLYESIVAANHLPPESRMPQAYHFAMLGNPGTGKTTVAKLIAKFLFEIQVRRKEAIEMTTGEKLARMGADAAAKLLQTAKGGTLFIDEAYGLDPAKNSDGASVALQLLDVAEEDRDDLSIIIAGYKDDIETRLFDFNDGFNRRFPFKFTFEDYTNAELAEIFRTTCASYKWKPASEDVVRVAVRRIARGRGSKSFGNAGAVRTMVESAYRAAVSAQRSTPVFEITDILGEKPVPENIPDLNEALTELSAMYGLESVKAKINSIVKLAQVNYDRELNGEDPTSLPPNRVFLGNPGTGKTTVAKIYGRVLKALGMLTDGQVEIKTPKDFMGEHVGATAKKTNTLISRCKGKVLVIDEAYGFMSNMYGAEAVDTLVGMVHNQPGEDIAIIMIGYDKEMRKMFRELNNGLTRRFSLDDPFVFADYNDQEIERIAVREIANTHKLRIAPNVRAALVRTVSEQRFAPNFGNAGTVITVVARAVERMRNRNPYGQQLLMEDIAAPASAQSSVEDPFSMLHALYKTDHIARELRRLQAVVEQTRKDGRDATSCVKNYLFIGNPGTGKTTVARMMAHFLHKMGLLLRNITVTRSGQDLQANYQGQTKDKVNEAMREAQGGLLFIDEAYTLGGGGGSHGINFAQEAVDQLVQCMTEPEHLHRTVVVLAGYPREMERMLATSNPGLASRISGRIDFPDWDVQDCKKYLQEACAKASHPLSAPAVALLEEELTELVSLPGWANARDCTSILNLLFESYATRQQQQPQSHSQAFAAATATATPTATAESAAECYTAEDVHYAIQSIASLRKRLVPSKRLTNPFSSQNNPIVIDLPPAQFTPSADMSYLMPPAPPLLQEHQQDDVFDETKGGNQESSVQEKQQAKMKGNDDDNEDPVYASLLVACLEEGYDDSHEQRQVLVQILERVHESAAEEMLPHNILSRVMQKTQLHDEKKVMAILRPQIHRILDGFRAAVAAEELHREEMKQLEREERLRQERQRELQRRKLQMMQLCPMGYSWHRCGDGSGWRCAGGSHFVTDDMLAMGDHA